MGHKFRGSLCCPLPPTRRMARRVNIGFRSFQDAARNMRGVGESPYGACALCLEPIRPNQYRRRDDCGHFEHSRAGGCGGAGEPRHNPTGLCHGRMGDSGLWRPCHANNPADRRINRDWVASGRPYPAPDHRDRLQTEREVYEGDMEARRRRRGARDAAGRSILGKIAHAHMRRALTRIRDRGRRVGFLE